MACLRAPRANQEALGGGRTPISMAEGFPSRRRNYSDLSHRAMAGPIPPSLGGLTNLEAIDLSSNELCGETT